MANDDVLIIGKLDDDALKTSIDKLVDYVAGKTDTMANSFDAAMEKMKTAMKDFAVTQKVSVDLIKDAWKDMGASFDAMFAAEKAATGGGKGSGKPTYDKDTLGWYREQTREIEKQREDLKLNSDELREQNRIIEERKRVLKEQTTSMASLRLDRSLRMPTETLDEANKKLRMLEILQRRYADTTELSEKQQKRLADAISRCKKEIDKFNSSRPKTLKEVMGMDETTLDAVAKKMRALRSVQVDPKNAAQVRALGNEYARLGRLQAELMGKNIQLTHSNNYLAQSFGYIRNRIVYALTLGAVSNFTKQIYEIRGQYELLERSLGILIDDMRRGSELFNELNAMALKSPFTLMELATGAKQLLAYNFAEEEVVDTTRRLADISAALGVPMERLVYNLGQIRAQTVLNARDARDFANAGLAIVPMLAQLYTEEKRFGDEIVTTSQVFDMMSKKLVSYGDVMKVINKVTDEGGKFFDFQAKQAETLKVKMANLTLSWNNMLNEIGQENQEALTMPLKGLKLLFENWKKVYDIIKDIIVLYGLYRARAILVAAVNGTLMTQAYITSMYNFGRALQFVVGAWKALTAAVVANPFGAAATVIAAFAASFLMFSNSVDSVVESEEKFGKAGAKVVRDAETLFNTLTNIEQGTSNYTKVLGELNSILNEYNIEQIKETDSIDVVNEKRKVAISLIQQEALERKHLNDIQQGQSEYDATIESIRKELRENLGDAITENFFGIGTINEELKKNAPAIANIVSDVIERNISMIAGKTGDEYEKGVEKIFAQIESRMKAIGISEETRSKGWLKNSIFRMFEDDIITNAINKMVEAKQKLDDYNKAIDENYEAEKKAAEQGSSFNDSVDKTANGLMKAANDTDKFAKKIETLLKQYGGQNIIDFLVKVKTDVPAWMANMGLTQLSQLAARFTSLAVNAKKAGKTSLDFGNGVTLTTQQLFERAAQYKQAAENKAADIEARKSTTITREASEALKEYKSAIEAVNVAKNRLKQGTADQALVTEKETAEQKAYNKALEKGVSLDELRKAKYGSKSSGSKKDPLGDALTKQVQLISDMQKMYKEYQKAGVDADTARIASAKEYQKTLEATNKMLAKYGLQGLSGEELATMDARALRNYYTQLRELADQKGNTKGVEALEKAIRSLNTEITKIDYKRITDGLNNELGKLKNEYELAIELDANPELGGIFADMMGISQEQLNDLPRNYEAVLKKLQAIIDSKLGSGRLDLSKNLSKAALDEWLKLNRQGTEQDDALAKMLNTFREYANKVRLDETKKQLESWDKLLEKYAEYEYKKEQIRKEYERETEIAIKKGASKDILDAITKRYNQQDAGLDFEEFKKSAQWIVATGDLAGMTHKALGMLIDDLTEYKKKAKNLDPKQIKEINRALKSLYKEQRKNNPFNAIADAIDEAKERMAEFQPEIDKTEAELRDLENNAKQENIAETAAKVMKLNEKLKDLQEQQKEAGEIDIQVYTDWFNSIISLASKAADAIGEMMSALAGTNGSGDAKAIKDMFDILGNAGQWAAVGGLIGGAYGAIIGGVFGAVQSVITKFADEWSGNADITRLVERSERSVKRLEESYVDLEHAMEKAYGVAEVGAQKAIIYNKELQLVELKRQLQLEESRKSKNKDYDRILDLKKQIRELANEITDSVEDITNNMLGISSVGNAAETLVSNMISAFRNGEKYMDSYATTFEEMVNNMIMKAIVSKVIGERIEELFASIQDRAKERAKKEEQAYKEALQEYESDRAYIDNWRGFIEEFYSFDPITGAVDRTKAITEEEWDAIWQKRLEYLRKQYEDAITPTPQDVQNIRDDVEQWRSDVQSEFEAWMNAFGIKYGQDASKTLSSLQQGIQGVTEDTAGAIEAYMNGVSQQVYLQSDLLREIRDIVVGFDSEFQMATLGEILLQLRSSYEMQMAIHAMMEGWTTPSGNGIRVELIS